MNQLSFSALREFSKYFSRVSGDGMGFGLYFSIPNGLVSAAAEAVGGLRAAFFVSGVFLSETLSSPLPETHPKRFHSLTASSCVLIIKACSP